MPALNYGWQLSRNRKWLAHNNDGPGASFPTRRTMQMDATATKNLEVWCYQRRPRDVPPHVKYDSLLLLENSVNSIISRAGKPLFTIEITPGQKHFRLLRDGKMAGFMINVTEQKGQQIAMSAIGSAPWIVAYVDVASMSMTMDNQGPNRGIFNNNNWRMIQAENLIAAAEGTGTNVAFVVERVEDVMGFARALEIGVDALVVRDDAPKELWEAVLKARDDRSKPQSAAATSASDPDPNPPKFAASPPNFATNPPNPNPPNFAANPPSIVKQKEEEPVEDQSSSMQLAVSKPTDAPNGTQQTGKASVLSGTCWRMPPSTTTASSVVADRVCIDFVRNLSVTEGCFVGSSSKVMALILSEAAESSLVPTRPFRVNAGPVHSYVCLADGISTKYLGELEAGEEILVFDAKTGKSRAVAVGRTKIEVRPCILVGLKEGVDDRDGQAHPTGKIFLQQAETVRLGQPGGEFTRVTDLEVAAPEEFAKQQPILLRVSSEGTHLGGRYSGKVVER